MIQKGVSSFQIIKHIYFLTPEMSIDFVDCSTARFYLHLNYKKKIFYKLLKFMPLLKMLVKRKSGKAKS